MLSRRDFVLAATAAGAIPAHAAPARTSTPGMQALRRDIVESPVGVALHRARTFTRVFQEDEGRPWVVRKATALNEYFRTVPLYVREHDCIAGSISETPGAMPLFVEIGIFENHLYLQENPNRSGYLKGKVPVEIDGYWRDRNLAGRYWTELRRGEKRAPVDPLGLLSNVGHLSPSYDSLLKTGIGGLLNYVRARLRSEEDAAKQAFLTAADLSLSGLSEWIRRYSAFLDAEAGRAGSGARAAELREMSRVASCVALDPPSTFREAMQLIWFVQQAIHIEGHGYSNTPDHVDWLLYPYYAADIKAGRLNDAEALHLCENFVLKMKDNSYWGPEHHLTQGLCLGGSSADGQDLTNRLSWLFVEAATNVATPEPLVWIRWHPGIDQKFFDFCLSRLALNTCFPMIWNDKAIVAAYTEMGVSREDAHRYLAVGCNELAIPGLHYFHSAAQSNYLEAMEMALTGGRGYGGARREPALAPPPSELATFEQFASAMGAYLRRTIEQSYAGGMQMLQAHMRWGQTPLTSCFFEGCVEKGQDLMQGLKYNFLSCGGGFFVTAVDSLAAIREVVYEKREASLEDVVAGCRTDFRGASRLRARLHRAPKHGNDDPRLDDIIRMVERMRDEPVRQICKDPRDGSAFGNTHVVRSNAVTVGLRTPATPDGRRAGAPLPSSMGGAPGAERTGPTAVLNSVCKLNGSKSWQHGYQVNLRFVSSMLSEPVSRGKVRAMLNVYFANGGQEIQINSIDSATLRAAQKNPEQYRDLVVRVAGFSEFFVNLRPEIQEEIISRTEHI